MKERKGFLYVLFSLIFATLACQIPMCTDGSDEEPAIPVLASATEALDQSSIEDSASPTADIGEMPIETPTSTATEAVHVELPVYVSPKLSSLLMFTDTRGWALADQKDVILLTVDGGETWLNATPKELDLAPASPILGIDAFFLDETTAWFTPNISGTSWLYQTQDSGQSWEKTSIPFENASYFFRNIEDGYALVDLGAGAGSHYVALYRTNDGGQTWLEVFSHEPGESKSLPEGGSKKGITFLNGDRGWIGGNRPMTDDFYLFVTNDGGRTWDQDVDIALPDIYSGSMLDVWQPFFLNNTTGYLPVKALTSSGDLYMMIYRTDDAGKTWTYQNSIKDGRWVDFTSVWEGWAVAEDALYQTNDGGQTWSLAVTSGIPAGEFFLGIEFVDDQYGWAVTSPDDSTWDPRKLYHTVDGGVTWALLLP